MPVEIELKFKVDNLEKVLEKLKGVKPRIFYVKDTIFGKKGFEYKIRKRIVVSEKGVEVGFEKTKPLKGKIKKVIEEDIKTIERGFKEENSYEKVRFLFKRNGCEVAIDFYPIGIYCEIEGTEKRIKNLAKRLGFDIEKNITKNIDAVYCEYCKRRRRNPRLSWGFGRI
ncbi:MAG: hypothetical protein ACTSR2_02845 [Candidatus Hodarchaeales archaeon]